MLITAMISMSSKVLWCTTFSHHTQYTENTKTERLLLLSSIAFVDRS